MFYIINLFIDEKAWTSKAMILASVEVYLRKLVVSSYADKIIIQKFLLILSISSHFVLSLPKDPISPEEFQAALVARKLNTLLDSDLINSVLNQYMIKKTRKIDCSQLVSDYMVLYPDTQPEPPKKKKPQKGISLSILTIYHYFKFFWLEKPTSKKSKMTKKIAPDTSGQPPEDTVRFELPEEQKLQSAVERSVEKITDIKMSIAQSENSVLTKEQQITAQGDNNLLKLHLH